MEQIYHSNGRDRFERLHLRPIGNSILGFAGNFNGQGFAIRNAKMKSGSKNYVGLFGKIDKDGVVADLGIQDANIAGKGFVGCLAGYNSGTISDCYSTGRM